MKKELLIMAIPVFMASCSGGSAPKVNYPELDSTNPLLAQWETPMETPPFSKIELSHYEPAFDAAIECSRAELEAIVSNPEKPSFENTIVPLENMSQHLNRVAGIFYALMNADTSDEMQQIAMRVQPKLTALSNDISLNPELFQRVKSVYENPSWGLSKLDKHLLKESYEGFARNGAALSDEDKELYRQYTTDLSAATIKFGQNALAATNAFTYNTTKASDVAELPAYVKEAMALEAQQRGEKGWTITLQYPSYLPFMTYSTNRKIKETLWMASNSRSLSGEFDNSETIRTIVALRLKIANILGYKNYAEYALANRMAESVESVNSFLNELLEATIAEAKQDYKTIEDYAHSVGFKGELKPWDFTYYSEKYKDATYALNDELVKPYFELSNVKKGVFLLAEKLYGLTFIERKDIDRYNEEVDVYEVRDENNEMLSVLYLDFFPRASKRSGAWMTEFRGTSVIDGVEKRPFVTIVMNFTKPTQTTPSLLTFDEVETFLHEFGHALHGMLAKGEYGSMNGTSVYRDFVELPSQLMENWATEKEFLDLWAKHYQTGEPMPADVIEKIVNAQNYNAAYQNVRQVQYAMLDMAWHSINEPYTGDIETFENKATERTAISPIIKGTAMGPGFTHIFSGGYAAGYYSYKWAEVLEADAFSIFKENGIFNPETASKFRHELLERGGQEHPMDLYVNFSGHKPQTKALIDKILGK